jgi:two-component system, NarL family, captular synthesis response regulator RcsB
VFGRPPSFHHHREKDNVKLRVVLADDHPFVVLGLRAALTTADGIEVVGEAANCCELFRILRDTPCDVVITDLAMPDGLAKTGDGLRLVHRLRRDWPALRIVVFTGTTSRAILRAAARAGASAILGKSESIHVLVSAVRDAAMGRLYIGNSADVGLAHTGGVSQQRHDAMTNLGVNTDPGLLAFVQAHGLS